MERISIFALGLVVELLLLCAAAGGFEDAEGEYFSAILEEWQLQREKWHSKPKFLLFQSFFVCAKSSPWFRVFGLWVLPCVGNTEWTLQVDEIKPPHFLFGSSCVTNL